jgi:hypothetical protein
MCCACLPSIFRESENVENEEAAFIHLCACRLSSCGYKPEQHEASMLMDRMSSLLKSGMSAGPWAWACCLIG